MQKNKNRAPSSPLSTLGFLTLLILPLLLTACAVDPIWEEGQALAEVSATELDQAEALAASGRSAQAAERYLALAAEAEPPARAQLRLKAARILLAAGDTSAARKALAAIRQGELSAAQRELLLLTEADLELLEGRPREAVARLERVRHHALPDALQLQYHGTLASAERLLDHPVAAARALDVIDTLLDRPQARLVNQVSLLSTLSQADPDRLDTLADEGKGRMRGWVEVLRLCQRWGNDPVALAREYRAWRGAHPRHPALPELARAYTSQLSSGYAKDAVLTVLLPRGGRFAGAATAVRDGIEAARAADDSGHRPALRFISSTDPKAVRRLHARATQGGADYVIGPLQKAGVDALSRAGRLTVPTLALNETTHREGHAEGLYQFSLSPDDEAAEVAHKARAAGLRRALILRPEGRWGERLARTFSHHWQGLGGIIVAERTVDASNAAYARQVTELTRNTAADLVFLIATPDLARLVNPLINKASAGRLPVIATSHVYSGGFERVRDRDLVGLYFVDIPWMLGVGGQGPLSRYRMMAGLDNTPDPLARLYAMGIDAYRLAPRMEDLARHPGSLYPGQTGGLSVDASGQIRRRLSLAHFTVDGPRPVEVEALRAAR
ncbi:penicillin-binding protein activator [Marichromatium bheemlicum]|uniref:Penicillin-binding protein activator n=1 Tax=Marichromatium bheemlicum TaxID=365339 RepID=A0ABX1I8W2_9GAMM|nr:penicillin-binding protein activator [Marichromatium bheemlicum]NKN33631.1 penicillin-binding protein activator [Marichromatium bheemlicum]